MREVIISHLTSTENISIAISWEILEIQLVRPILGAAELVVCLWVRLLGMSLPFKATYSRGKIYAPLVLATGSKKRIMLNYA